MANDLENLNEKMNRSVLKDIRFEEKHKKHVMKTIKQSTNGHRKNRFVWTRKLNAGLSIGISAALIVGVIYYGGEKMGLIDSGDKSPHQIDNKITPPQDTKNIEQKSSVYEPKKQEEYYGEMTEKEVLTKMLNTVDHFKTAIGSFEVYSLYHDGSSAKRKTEYQISLGKENEGGFSKVTSTRSDKKDPSTQYRYYYNGKMWELNENTKSYLERKYQQKVVSNHTLTLEEAFFTDSEGINVTNYRERPPIGPGSESIFPYEIASNYTRDFNNWEIEKQNEELIGHNTIVLYGKLNGYAAKKFSSVSFRFWVDKDTGILVKYETYDSNGDVVNYLHPNELHVNVPIDTSVFEPNLDGYEKFEFNNHPAPDSRQQFVKQVAFAKGYDEKSFKEVNSVLERMRKEISELYEFNDSSLKLTLVDYETYKEIPQGVLLYRNEQSFNSGDTDVKNIRVRFQQEKAYHKEDFVNIDKKAKKVDEFELNGIQWTVRKDKTTFYYIGKKDDYTYEIVAAHYTLEEANKLLKTFKPSK